MLAVKKFNRFRACFDESLNHVPNNKQIDVYLFYFIVWKIGWLDHILDLSFMGHGDAVWQFDNLVHVNNLVQISSDGPI